VDVVALGAYVLAEVDGGMLPNTWNVDQLRKYYVLYLYMIKGIQVFLPMKLTSYPAKIYVFTCVAPRTKSKGLLIGGPLLSKNICFLHAYHRVQKAKGSRSMLHTCSITFNTRFTTYKKQGAP
jgi:hypothetical protein